jgi:6-phosphofructokinase
LINLGNAAPGQNNIVDGMLKFQLRRKNVQLVGYLNGVDGIKNDRLQIITEESYAPYRNLGGCDYLGRSGNISKSDFQMIAESVSMFPISWE